MKKGWLICLIVCVALVVTSCSSTSISGYGVTTNLATREYKELGKVVIPGQISYSDLLSKAKELYPDCDALIDVIQEDTISTLLFVIKIPKRTTTATAIQWLDDFSATEVKNYSDYKAAQSGQ